MKSNEKAKAYQLKYQYERYHHEKRIRHETKEKVQQLERANGLLARQVELLQKEKENLSQLVCWYALFKHSQRKNIPVERIELSSSRSQHDVLPIELDRI